MPRIHRMLAFVLVAWAIPTAHASAHDPDPRYESRVTSITGMPDGVSVSVRNRDDELVLVNDSDRELVVHGYEGEPYVRLEVDGTVAVNDDSPATYLSTERDGRVTVPDGVDGEGEPRWRVVDRSGRFAWHDHRIHWMARTRPPQVTDPDEPAEIFDWTVDVSVSGQAAPATIAGTLRWTPRRDDSPPTAAVLGAVAVLGAGAALVLRRRRPPGRGAPHEGHEP